MATKFYLIVPYPRKQLMAGEGTKIFLLSEGIWVGVS